jgi:IPT/TIG domain-containing protein/WD40 repeat protein
MAPAFRNVLAASIALFASRELARAQTTTRITVGPGGVEANGASTHPQVSADGRFVVFESSASNLDLADTNGFSDVFVHDRATGVSLRVSMSSIGFPGDGDSIRPSISADGRFVAFVSTAASLVWDDTNGFADVFVHDRVRHVTTRVSVDSAGNPADGESGVKYGPCLSADGRYVSFTSLATNLVPNDNNAAIDVFVHDRLTGVTSRASVGMRGVEGDADSYSFQISADGRFVPFHSLSTNWIAGGSGGTWQEYVHDRLTGRTELESVGPNGEVGIGNSLRGSISDDGRWVAFESDASNLVTGDRNPNTDVFVRDRASGMTSRITVLPNGDEAIGTSISPRISGDGRYVLFASDADGLIPRDQRGYWDVCRHDRSTGSTLSASLRPNGRGANGPTIGGHFMSADASVIVFGSDATDLVAGDGNHRSDVFVRDLNASGPVWLTSVLPGTGSELGDDFVVLEGGGFDSSMLNVWFGLAPARIVSITPTRLTVKTPPGIGIVDVSVASSIGMGVGLGAFAYEDPQLAARRGNVNVGAGSREDVLRIDGDVGDDSRQIAVNVGRPLEIEVGVPSSRATARFVLYAWRGSTDLSTLTPLPRSLGRMTFAPPFVAPSAGAQTVFNNAGRSRLLGQPLLPSSPAPFTFASRGGVRRSATVTIQGVIEDARSAIPDGWSLTNAIELVAR